MTAADAAALPRAPTSDAIHAIGAAAGGPRHPRRARASRSSSRRCIRATRARRSERVMAELYAARCVALALLRAQLRHRPQHRRRGGRPARPLARPARARCAPSPRSPAGTASASSCRPTRSAAPFVIDWLDRPRAPQPTAASWCAWSRAPTGTARSSARRSTASPDYPVFTRKAHTDVSYLACARKLLAAPDARLPAVRHPQRAHARRRSTRWPATRAGQYEFQCLHGMGEPLYEQVVGEPTASSAALPHLRAGRHARDAARLSGAPPARERRQLLVRQPHRRRRRSPIEELVADPVRRRGADAEGAHRRAASRDPAAARALRRARAQLARPRPRRRAALRGARRRRCVAGRASALAAPTPLAAAARGDGAARSRCAIRPTATTSSARVVEATPPTSTRPSRRRGGAAAAGRRPPPAERAAMLERAADLLEAHAAALHRRWPCARPARPLANGIAEVREAVDFLRYYARAGARASSQRHARAARPGRLHQPVELPAGDLHRPGRGRARRRQRGARQAGRADAADRRRGRARCCTRPACRATRCSSCPARGETVGARAGRRPAHRRRAVHRLDRGRAADQPAARRDATRRTRRALIAETGGQNAMIVDSSALPEQVVRDVARLGLRQRRPALLGAARALRAGGRRRPHARDAARRDGASCASATPSDLADRRRPGHRRRGARRASTATSRAMRARGRAVDRSRAADAARARHLRRRRR